jgi:nucleotide-binding universal stress UspA family protein
VGNDKTITSDILLRQRQEIILAQAEQRESDMIALGSRGSGGVARLLLGPVSSAALSHANCSIEIARQRRAA